MEEILDLGQEVFIIGQTFLNRMKGLYKAHVACTFKYNVGFPF